MVRKPTPTAKVENGDSGASDPILVRCELRVPKDEADAVLPHLGLAFGCGGAVMKKTRSYVKVQADIEIRTVGAIVEMGVPVLVTERIPVSPIPAKELIRDAAAWFRHVRRLG